MTMDAILAALGATSDAFVLTDLDGGVQWCSAPDRFREGHPLVAQLDDDTRAPLAAALAVATSTRQRVETPRWRLQVVRWRTLDSEGYAVSFEERSEEEQALLEELAEARRLESVAHLTANVAHNFNNMLMVVGPSIEELAAHVPADVAPVATHAQEAVERATRIVERLLVFSGQQHAGARSLEDAAALCRRAVRLARPAAGPARIRVDVGCTGSVRCAPTAVEEVLVNLLRNACDAVSEQEAPEVGLVAEDVHLGDELWLQITVWDNGPGVPEALTSRIFEPFFTTKGTVGTGLGLASSHAIVAEHEGQLVYRPRAPRGAEFLVLLPAQPADPGPTVQPPAPAPAPAPPERLRILLVDDEPAITMVLARGLPRTGPFELRTMGSADELRDALPELRDIDVVMLDRSLTHEGSMDLVAPLRAQLPGARIVFFTGHPLAPEEAAQVEGVILKPIAPRQLAQQLLELA